MVVGPLSMTRSIRPSRSASTCSARVGEIRFDEFALGAAMGWPTRSMRAASHGALGDRSATVSCPAVTRSGMMALRRRTSVSGPGQKCSASRCASSGQSLVHARASGIPATCTMSGLIAGLPFAAKIRATAAGWVAIAPRP